MTLHLAFLCPTVIVVVSDRLLTVKTSDGTSDPYDAYANKTVVVFGENCNVYIGYTGLAHIDGAPTADWIAEQIIGTSRVPPLRPGGGRPIQGGTDERLHLERILTKLSQGLERDLPRQRGEGRIRITVTGFVFARRWWLDPIDPRHSRPFYRTLEHCGNAGCSTKVVEDSPRVWRPNRHLVTLGADVPQGISHALARDLWVLHGTDRDVEERLVRALRETAAGQASPTIGRDCMAVSLDRASLNMRVRFNRSSEHPLASFTPFVISHGLIVPPQLISGSLMPNFTGTSHPRRQWSMTVEVDPPLPPSGSHGSHSYRHKPWPDSPQPHTRNL